jgi:hypothetical protein
MPQSREVLVIRGRLDRAGRFAPGRSRSTPNVREWPVVTEGDVKVTVELLDEANRVLHREPARVRAEIGCQPGDPQTYRVTGYIQLRDDAAAVRLMRGDLELWRDMIPAPPTLDVKVSRVRGAREKPLTLRLRYSPPGENAHVTVVYKWGERRFRPIYIGRPKPEIAINLRELPGGDECLLAVSYSNGLRSAHAATEMFRVPKIGPTVSIVRPDARASIVAGTPVILEGNAFDPERAGGAKSEDLVWLIDEKEVATGLIASVDGLAAGRHRVTLAYRSRPGAEASTTVSAKEAQTPTANNWPEWDPIAGNN